MRYAPYPFLALGITFIAIGISAQRPLIYIGVVFLIVAFLGLLRIRS